MATSVPDRYRLEVRLGRDEDIEEWLATDTSLDRPVLIRSLGPETTLARREEFLESVSNAAKPAHAHLARVFAVGEVEGGAYAVIEWTGGATLADRVEARQPIELPEFLPNASGLAGALSALHAAGATHGHIDASSVSYSGAHPAKLGGFGRAVVTDQNGDVRALSAALETALTGSPPGGPPPSERVDGVPRAIDGILRSGQSGALSAQELEKALRAAPTPRPPRSDTGPTSRRLLLTAVALVVMAVLLVGLGIFLSGGSSPVVPTPTSEGSASQTTITTAATTTTALDAVMTLEAQTLDPYGEGGENDQLVDALTDGDTTTEWLTERYLDPITSLKPGVGVHVGARGIPGTLEIVNMTEGSAFGIYWAREPAPEPDGWEPIARARAAPGTTTISLPRRADGYWLIWLTDLGSRDDGTFQTAIAELRFRP